MKITPSTIQAMKGRCKIVALTAYSHPLAQLLDPFCDILLVGDSVATTLYGMENTLNVSLDTMIRHATAVVRGTKCALVVVDMPAGTYEKSREQALENARRLINETGADAVKLEGGVDMQQTVEFLTQNNINVMGHVGLLPQRSTICKWQGRTKEESASIVCDADSLEKAGVFAIVIEAVKESLANKITSKLKIPTIGIGAGRKTDGQVLVVDDMLGMSHSGFQPKFVKKYTNIAKEIEQAAALYQSDVRNGIFPAEEHCYREKI